MQVTLEIPDELVGALTPPGQETTRAALEAFALEAYRQRRISGHQLRTLLGLRSRWDLDAFLAEHQVAKYTVEDFEKDLAAIREPAEKQGSDRPA